MNYPLIINGRVYTHFSELAELVKTSPSPQSKEGIGLLQVLLDGVLQEKIQAWAKSNENNDVGLKVKFQNKGNIAIDYNCTVNVMFTCTNGNIDSSIFSNTFNNVFKSVLFFEEVLYLNKYFKVDFTSRFSGRLLLNSS